MYKIAIVGNGTVNTKGRAAASCANLVVRFNDCRSYSLGERCDVVAVCNTGRPAKEMLNSNNWRTAEAVRVASEVWCVRDPVKFAVLKPILAASRPELDDFCDDYTAGFGTFCRSSGKVHRIIPGLVHEDVDNALTSVAAAPYVIPSSGMVVIMDVLTNYPEAQISIVGFDHVGWEGHPFASERRLVDDYVASGRLHRIA